MCAAFGLTVSEAKTEITCLRAKGVPESTATFSVEAAGQVYNKTNEFVYLGGSVNHNADLSIEVNRRIRNACMVQLPEVHPRTVRPTERSLRAQNPDTKTQGTRDNAVRLRACHYDTLRRAHHRFFTRCIGCRRQNRADQPISYLDTLVKTGSDSIEAYDGGGSCLRDLWRAWRIRDCRSAWCSENWWGARPVWGARKKSG